MVTLEAGGNFISKNLPFLLFFLLFTVLAWDVTAPMAAPVTWAAMMSFVSMPIFRFLDKKTLHGRHPSLAAGLTLLILLLICFIPIIFMLSTLAGEAAGMGSQLAGFFAEMQKHAFSGKELSFPSWVPVSLAEYIKAFLNNSAAVKKVLQTTAQYTATMLTGLSAKLFEHGTSLMVNTMITLMVSFFFIRDGAEIVAYMRSITPLSPEEKADFYSRTGKILNAVVFGVILTVAIQALLGGLGWWFVGLGSPVFFGMLMFLFGMFPAGTAIVWVPGSIYLALTGDTKNAVILFLWGAVIVGMIDNVLRPFLISGGKEGVKIPTLLTILGLFGGVMKWGFLGIFIGPLVLVLFVSVCDLYRNRWEKFCR